MKDFFISYNGADRSWAEWIAWQLESEGYTTVIQAWDFLAGSSFPVEMQQASVDCTRTIAVLSMNYLNASFTQPEWAAAFSQDPTGSKGILIPVRIDAIDIPGMLGSIVYIDLVGLKKDEAREKLLAEIEKRKQGRGKPVTEPPFPKMGTGPAFPPDLPFKPPEIGDIGELVGRDDALAWLKQHLIDQDSNTVALASLHGAGGMGKTFLAQAFANRFKDTASFIPVYLGETTPFNAGLELLNRLDVDTSSIDTPDKLREALHGYYSHGSGILVFDDVRSRDITLLMPQTRRFGVLMTTRDKSLARALCGDRHVRELDVLALPEAIQLYRKVLGNQYYHDKEHDYEALAQYLSCRPYSIRLSAGYLLGALDPSPSVLLKRLETGETPSLDVDYSFDKLAQLLHHCLAQLKDKSPFAHDLLNYLASCSDEGIALNRFTEWQSSLHPSLGIDQALQQARSLGLLLVEHHSADSQTADSHPQRLRLHADLLRILRTHSLDRETRAFSSYLKNALIDRQYGPVLDVSLQAQVYALIQRQRNSPDLVSSLYDDFWIHLFDTGRLQWAHELGSIQLKQIDQESDPQQYQRVFGNQALILQNWGRLEEAMALHKKQEAICQDFGNQDGLQKSYGNQALILQDWGRLDEAMELNKKEEAICRELGNKDGLSKSYSGQGLILQDWGRLDEAVELYKKEEAICKELGDKDGLQRSYGNQALILQAWGRLDEAMELHKIEEAISQELGNKDGLQISYCNQGLILKAWGRLDEAMELHKKQEAICQELGSKDSLQISYFNQALILKAWGRLDEAMELHKKQEAICEELGNKNSLQASYGSQALILKDWGRLDEAMELHKKQEAICEELGNKGGLQISYGNQAVILKVWGRLDEAMELHKKEEAICQELGNKDGLQRSYGNQAVILKAWGRPEEAEELIAKQQEIKNQIK